MALASMALLRRTKVTVESGYMPQWFIEGRDPK